MSTPFSLDSMKPLAGRVLQEGLNRALRLDPASREKLQALEGRRIEAHLQSPDIALAIDVREGLLQVGPVDAAREADEDEPGHVLRLILQEQHREAEHQQWADDPVLDEREDEHSPIL